MCEIPGDINIVGVGKVTPLLSEMNAGNDKFLHKAQEPSQYVYADDDDDA